MILVTGAAVLSQLMASVAVGIARALRQAADPFESLVAYVLVLTGLLVGFLVLQVAMLFDSISELLLRIGGPFSVVGVLLVSAVFVAIGSAGLVAAVLTARALRDRSQPSRAGTSSPAGEDTAAEV